MGGVGASLDGSYLRLFVNLGGEQVEANKKLVSSKAVGAAAAAAAVGALLGCETEILAGEALPAIEANPDKNATVGVATPTAVRDSSIKQKATDGAGRSEKKEQDLKKKKSKKKKKKGKK